LTINDHCLHMTAVSSPSAMTVSFSVTYVKHILTGITRFRTVMPCVSVYIFLELS